MAELADPRGEISTPRGEISTAAEDRFVELFAEAFGVEKVQLLSPEHPVQDIYGATRFVDFAIRTPAQRVAFEIDGLVWHHPEAISIAKFEDDILRQNSLIHDAWRVYRWTDRQLAEDGERVKEQLIRLKTRTGIGQWNILCRWAFCLSLAEPTPPTPIEIPADSNVEMSWPVFGGEYP